MRICLKAVVAAVIIFTADEWWALTLMYTRPWTGGGGRHKILLSFIWLDLPTVHASVS